MGTPLKVLVVEDSTDDLALLLHELERGGYEVAYERVETAQELTTALSTDDWDLILSDYSLPGFNAPAALKIARESEYDLPFIIVSGTVGEDVAVAAMKAGAHDFFPKDKLTLLVPAIERELREAAERRERRLIEEELALTQERYRSLFENIPIGLYRATPDGQVLEANAAAVQMLGYPDLQSFLAVNAAEWSVSHENRLAWVAMMKQQGMVSDFEAPLRRYDGGRIWCIMNARAVPDAEGKMQYYEGSLQNIHNRKKTEEELNALYNALSILFKSDGLLSLGHQIVEGVVKEFRQVDCGLMLVDRNNNQMLRVARSGAYGVDTDVPLYLDGPGLVPESVKSGQIVYAPNVTSHPDYVRADPRTKSELVVPLKTVKGLLGVLDLQSPEVDAFDESAHRILTAFAERAAFALETMQLYEEVNRYAAELEWRVIERTTQLQHTKERVEAILNGSSDAIILTDARGIIQNANPAFTMMFGYQVDEMFNRLLSTLAVPDDKSRLDDAIHAVLRGEPSTRTEVTVCRADGTPFHADVAFSLVHRDDDDLAGIVCSVRDMTIRRQMEEELRKALAQEKDLNELKSRFVSTVSHEFRTPLTVILSATGLLQQYFDRMSEEKRQEHLKQIQIQVERLVGLLDDILTLSRAEAISSIHVTAERLDLSAFCQDIVREIQQTTQKHQINFAVEGKQSPVLMDAKLMRQAISNLISNAVKYSPDGGRVRLGLVYGDDQVIIQVQDSGIGIPESDQKHLFEAFHRAHNAQGISGTGLGLPIVKRAVEAHKGTVDFESVVGVGTTFTICIPLS